MLFLLKCFCAPWETTKKKNNHVKTNMIVTFKALIIYLYPQNQIFPRDSQRQCPFLFMDWTLAGCPPIRHHSHHITSLADFRRASNSCIQLASHWLGSNRRSETIRSKAVRQEAVRVTRLHLEECDPRRQCRTLSRRNDRISMTPATLACIKIWARQEAWCYGQRLFE